MKKLKKFSTSLENLKKKLNSVVLRKGISVPKEIPDIEKNEKFHQPSSTKHTEEEENKGEPPAFERNDILEIFSKIKAPVRDLKKPICIRVTRN